MTVRELIARLSQVDPQLKVRYNYDTGNDFPEIEHVYIAESLCFSEYGQFLCLDERPADSRDLIVRPAA